MKLLFFSSLILATPVPKANPDPKPLLGLGWGGGWGGPGWGGPGWGGWGGRWGGGWGW